MTNLHLLVVTSKNPSLITRFQKKKIRNIWRSMLRRCYDPKLHKRQPCYIGCSVCDEWKIFDNFYDWVIKQDWQGNQLDKDIINPSNKIYSPENCAFISKKLNTLLVHKRSNKGIYPTGVSFHKPTGKYQATITRNGKFKHLGFFKTINLAQEQYILAKIEYIKTFFDSIKDPRIINGLKKHIALIRQGK